MSTPYAGKPANVENNLPAAVNISSTTNATPIVITTATAHGLSVGEFFVVLNADDNALNGIALMAGTVTSTTVVALVAPGGTNTVGTVAGGANGTVRSLQYGSTVPLLADGDPYAASSWNVYEAAIADRVAWLEYLTQFAQIIVAGGELTIAAGADVLAVSGATFSGFWNFVSTSIVQIAGRRVRGARATLSDADHTVDVTQGNRFILPDPAAPRVITLDETTGSPKANETIEFICTSNQTAGNRWTFKTATGAVVVATFVGPAGVAAINPNWAEFEFVGGVWRLGEFSGAAWDSVAGSEYGVIPGPGA